MDRETTMNVQALSGTDIKWVDTSLGTSPWPSCARNGDLATNDCDYARCNSCHCEGLRDGWRQRRRNVLLGFRQALRQTTVER